MPSQGTTPGGTARSTLTLAANLSQGTLVTVTVSSPGAESKRITVTIIQVSVPVITLISPVNGQASGQAGATLPSFVVNVTSGSGGPNGTPVTWTVAPAASGTMVPAQGQTSGGNASSTLTLAANLSQGNQVIVTVSSPGAEAKRITVTVSAAPVVNIAIISGNNQTGVVNAQLPQPLVVSVVGSSATSVVWDAHGGGIASPNPSPIVNGQSQTIFTISGGATSGPITVTASVPGGGGGPTSVNFSVNNGTQTVVTNGLKSFSAIVPMAISTTTVQTTNLGLRLAALRKGAGGISMSGLSVNVDGLSVPLDAVSSLVPPLGKGGGASSDSSSILGGKLGAFLTGQGTFGSQDATSREPGFAFHTAGLTVGADYRLTDNLALGAAFGYVNAQSELDASAGHFTTNGYSFSGYGTYFASDKIYLDGIVTYGWNNYKTTRNDVIFSDTGSTVTAKGSPNGTQFSVSAGGGYNFNFGALTAGPTARVNYIWSYVDNFKESGAGIFDLQVASQTVQSLTTDLGAQVYYAFSFSWGVLQPLLTIEWEHQFLGNSYLINGNLLGGPTGAFGTPTNNPDRDYFNLGAALQ